MIKFFREIRFKLINENKASKYLKYALGEIILVVIGIFIALQLNNWNEERKKINLSRRALIELQEEVQATKRLIARKNEVNVMASEIMKKYLEGSYIEPNDSIKNMVVGYSFAYNPIQLSIPVIEREISGNNLIIGQKSLINKLQKFKDTQIFANQLKFYLDSFWNENVITYLKDQGLMLSFVSKAKMIDIKVEGLSTLYDSNEFKDLIAMEYMHVESYRRRINELVQILNEIDVELENSIEASKN